MEISDNASRVPSVSILTSQNDSIVDDDFIEAKDTKKNRKKSAKAKGVGTKVTPMASVDVSVGSSPADKGKNTIQIQQENELLLAVQSGTSLGNFVVWKESSSPSPAPAWSTDSGKPHKPASLRDILKEQERKVSSSSHAVQVPTSQKSATNQPASGTGPSRSDFPQLRTHGSWGSKRTPVKGTLGGSLNGQKSIGGRPVEYPLSASASSTQVSLKEKKNTLTKHAEAVDFKEWCESECIKLVGSEDTSFLEFYLKQSRAEAEMLLIENLGSFDPDHEFIDKFLNYKDFLPADVLDIAFKNRNDRNATALGTGDMTSIFVGIGRPERGNVAVTDEATKGGKKKGKKGKKVSPSVLGFNMVSKRIMMGEIHTIDD